MNRLFLVKVIVICALLVFGMSSFFYSYSVIQNVEKINTEIIIQRGAFGLNADTNALKFGSLSPGNAATRSIRVYSNQSSWVAIQSKGEAAQWLWVSNESFMINKDKEEEIQFKMQPPPEAPEGNYSGEVVIIFKAPWIKSLETFK